MAKRRPTHPKHTKQHAKRTNSANRRRGFEVSTRHTATTAPEVVTVKEPIPQTSSFVLFGVNLRLLRLYGAPLLVMVAIPGLLAQLGTVMAGTDSLTTTDPTEVTGLIVRLVAAVWSLLGLAPSYYYVLRVLGGNPAGIMESYRYGLRYTWSLLLVGLTIGLTVLAGLALFIVPGLIFLRRYFLAGYFAIDENLGVREAMVRSSQASRPARRAVWSMLFCLALVAGLMYAAANLIPVYGAAVASLLSIIYVFLPALRYQEITSDTRAGAKALRATPDR